jgi:hypothetical protein
MCGPFEKLSIRSNWNEKINSNFYFIIKSQKGVKPEDIGNFDISKY